MSIIERAARSTATRDREKLLRLAMEQAREARYADTQLYENLKRITDLFLPDKFGAFIKVDQPFRYAGCNRGAEIMQSAFFSLPTFMTVVPRTDLSLEEPARNGCLVYYKRRVQGEIEKIFPP
jgi:hypothetical protein